jgi:putative transposase
LRQNIRNEAVLELVKCIRKTHPLYGLRKLHHTVKKQGFRIGRDGLRTLLQQSGLLFKPRYGRISVRTTDSRHTFRLYPNLLRLTTVVKPEQVWVTDITYIRINGSFYFLALVCDAYSRKIMGWDIQEQNTSNLTCNALVKANMERLYPENTIIHHSDRGIQYCSGLYRMLLYKLNMQISTTESGDPRENAIMERVIRTLKYEYSLRINFSSVEQAINQINYAIETYNHSRIHYSCNMNTPAIQHLIVKKPPILV